MDLIQSNLKANNIPSVVYYPIPLSKQIGYTDYPSVSTGLDTSNLLSDHVLSLPMHPYLSEEEINNIVSKIVGD